MVTLIAAVGECGAIGRDGRLPWKISEDLRFFKSETMGKPVIVGRKTFEKLPPLPGRRIIVVTSRDISEQETARSVEDAVAMGGEDSYIAGGSEVYSRAAESGLFDRAMITWVNGIFPDADSFDHFTHSLAGWRETEVARAPRWRRVLYARPDGS
jgi:dihydrofolate reductase